MYIKDFDRFVFHKTKNKSKKYFCESYLQCFISQKMLTKSVRLEKGTTKFKNHFKQIPVPFKVYADSECNLESVESYERSYSKKY